MFLYFGAVYVALVYLERVVVEDAMQNKHRRFCISRFFFL
jgi:hypothetical protein